ncbi:MAG: LamB/YcsF family protein [Christensenellaceae bacterium]|nr:LamB/YcsF family protein [Christensenellaceae bacterium]
MLKVDLNSDLGESFGNYKLGLDEEVLAHVTSANIACGWHAGDPLVLDKTIAMAKEHGVAIGAHTGFPDLLGFGRRNMAITPYEAYTYTKYQLGAFYAFAQAHDVPIQHVKPHGAFYNMCAVDKKLSAEVCRAIKEFDKDIIVMALAGSKLVEAAEEAGLRAASEFFADRAYMDDGTLAPRSMEGSVIHDKEVALARIIKMIKTGTVTTVNGNDIALKCQSICVHGDNKSAVDFVSMIRTKLAEEGIEAAPLRQIV